MTGMDLIQRRALLAPDVVARRLANHAPDARGRWMLKQPRDVRASFAREAFDGDDRVQEIWMLRQADAVRESYVREVLGG